MLETYLIEHRIVNAVMWIVLYTGDYYLTLWGSNLSRRQSIIRYEGSYEMEPEYQEDIDSRRKISPHFVVWLLVGSVALLLPIPNVNVTQKVYAVLIGALIVPELIAHIKHAENIWLWRKLTSASPGASGSVCFGLVLSYRRAAINTLGLGAVILVAAALGSSCILLGGGFMMLVLSLSQYRIAGAITKMQAVMAEEPK